VEVVLMLLVVLVMVVFFFLHQYIRGCSCDSNYFRKTLSSLASGTSTKTASR
jgi:preprotein translocase subunit YajC